MCDLLHGGISPSLAIKFLVDGVWWGGLLAWPDCDLGRSCFQPWSGVVSDVTERCAGKLDVGAEPAVDDDSLG